MNITENINKVFNKIVYPFLYVLAPRHCEICKNSITENKEFEFICIACLDLMTFAPNKDINYNLMLKHIEKENIFIDEVFALFSIKEDNRYMDLIYSLKYLGLHNIGLEFGQILGRKIIKEKEFDYNIVTSVPIHKARNRERGYNQSDYIAQGANKVLNLFFDNKLIKRKLYTKSQTLLKKSERIKNVSDIFDIYSETVNFEDKNIIIFDDVLTTGSTLNSVAKTLKEFGASKVSVATIALAL